MRAGASPPTARELSTRHELTASDPRRRKPQAECQAVLQRSRPEHTTGDPRRRKPRPRPQAERQASPQRSRPEHTTGDPRRRKPRSRPRRGTTATPGHSPKGNPLGLWIVLILASQWISCQNVSHSPFKRNKKLWKDKFFITGTNVTVNDKANQYHQRQLPKSNVEEHSIETKESMITTVIVVLLLLPILLRVHKHQKRRNRREKQETRKRYYTDPTQKAPPSDKQPALRHRWACYEPSSCFFVCKTRCRLFLAVEAS